MISHIIYVNCCEGNKNLKSPRRVGIGKLPRRRSDPELRSSADTSSGYELTERGQDHSTLVSAGIPPSIVNHWFVRMCRVTLAAWGRLVRTLAVTDSILSAIVRVGIALAASISMVLAVIGVCSVLQRNGNYYIKLLDYHRLEASNEVRFNHIISNATIRLVSPNETSRLKSARPRYAACDLSWSGNPDHEYGFDIDNNAKTLGLTVLDLALLSEVAYIDDDSELFADTSHILDDLFPGLGMRVISAPQLNTEGINLIPTTAKSA